VNEKTSPGSIALAKWTEVFADFPMPKLLMEQSPQVVGWSFSDQSMDWNYYMRREMQEILPGLYLGPYAAANKSKLSSLLEQGITHIVCIRQDADASFVRPNFEDRFKYLVLNIVDSPIENIIPYIPKVSVFLDSCFQSGGKALIHGNTGISRSAADDWVRHAETKSQLQGCNAVGPTASFLYQS